MMDVSRFNNLMDDIIKQLVDVTELRPGNYRENLIFVLSRLVGSACMQFSDYDKFNDELIHAIGERMNAQEIFMRNLGYGSGSSSKS